MNFEVGANSIWPFQYFLPTSTFQSGNIRLHNWQRDACNTYTHMDKWYNKKLLSDNEHTSGQGEKLDASNFTKLTQEKGRGSGLGMNGNCFSFHGNKKIPLCFKWPLSYSGQVLNVPLVHPCGLLSWRLLDPAWQMLHLLPVTSSLQGHWPVSASQMVPVLPRVSQSQESQLDKQRERGWRNKNA